MPTPFRLFYSDGACSLVPHIALEETGAAFEQIRIDMASGERRKTDFLRINPQGCVPALAVDDPILTENPTILQFVTQSFPDAGRWPRHLRDQAGVAEWLGWIASIVRVAYAHGRRAEYRRRKRT